MTNRLKAPPFCDHVFASTALWRLHVFTSPRRRRPLATYRTEQWSVASSTSYGELEIGSLTYICKDEVLEGADAFIAFGSTDPEY